MFVQQEELTWLGGERLDVQGRRCPSMKCVGLATILITFMCMCIHMHARGGREQHWVLFFRSYPRCFP